MKLRRTSALALLVSLLWSTGCYMITDSRPVGGYLPTGEWVVSGAQGATLFDEGALFLDARDVAAFEAQHVVGSQLVSWLDFSEPASPRQGLLLEDDEELGARLRAIGVSSEQTVVVIGEPIGGWGEDGRISWMLRALGHPHAALVDGGLTALSEAGVPLSDGPDLPPTRLGDFVVARDPTLSIEIEELRGLVETGGAALVDTRERREFDGETPYGESRGGHLPGAVHLHYEELIGADGRLLSRNSIVRALADSGVDLEEPVVSYCTGGVRSGWLVAVLRDVGYSDVRNYPGSMWEWSAEDPMTHPLE